MPEIKSHWTLGLVYINPDDSRLFVPLPCNLGLAINFGHPRCVHFLFWIWALFIIGLMAGPIVIRNSYFANDLTPLFWVISANLTAVVIIRLNNSLTLS